MPTGTDNNAGSRVRLHHVLALLCLAFVAVTTTAVFLALDSSRQVRNSSEAQRAFSDIIQATDRLETIVRNQQLFGTGDPMHVFPTTTEEERLAEVTALMGELDSAAGVLSPSVAADYRATFVDLGESALNIVAARNPGVADVIRFDTSLADARAITHLAEAAESERLLADAESGLRVLELAALLLIVAVAALVVIGWRVARHESELSRELETEREFLQAIVDSLPTAVSWKDRDLRFVGGNSRLSRRMERFGTEPVVGVRISDLPVPAFHERWLAVEKLEREAMATGNAVASRIDEKRPDGDVIHRFVASPLLMGGEVIGTVTSSEDITQVVDMERKLAQANRLEAIGSLAAGVAHEINTPVQYVSDNNAFLKSSFGEMLGVFDEMASLCRGHDGAATDRILAGADVDFIREEIPAALDQTADGLEHVASIVRAMKSFSHPEIEATYVDVNDIIKSTVTISRNEWKYIAELDLDLDPDLGVVECRGGQIKQVVLNMLVNAAHAVADNRTADDPIGRITIASRSLGDAVRLIISDTGAGIAPNVRDRIFEPFFTTKEVGAGTGQGLAMAWDVVRAHRGTIQVDTTLGRGTTFTVDLPRDSGAPRLDVIDPGGAVRVDEPVLAG